VRLKRGVRRSIRWGLAGITIIGLGVAAAGVASAADTDGTVRNLGAASSVKDSFIVVLKDRAADRSAVDAASADLTRTYGGSVRKVFSRTVRGFSARMTAAQATRLATSDDVAYVEQDRQVKPLDAQSNPPSWGLDRLDQADPARDNAYRYPGTAGNVHAYVVDTGIRISHEQFGGRASYGVNEVDNNTDADDCNGHGTHVAGTIGGRDYGVAKGVQLVAVRVLGCNGSGTVSDLTAGIDWVTANAVKPAVANVSIGAGISATLDAAVRNSIASGITYAIAAGNEGQNACNSSPSDVGEAIVVGATDETDTRASFSNHGSCLDLFAPGVSIRSSYNTSDYTWVKASGTSMAAPHVAGAAALLVGANPGLNPAQVRNAMVNAGVRDAVHNPAAGSPNVLLQVSGADQTPPPVSLLARVNGRFVTAGAVPLLAGTVVAGDPERFDVQKADGGNVTLRSRASGLYVTAEEGGKAPLIANRPSVGDWEKFVIADNGDGSVSLRANANGKYVTAENSGNAPLVANRTSVGDWERFIRFAPVTVIGLARGGTYVTAENLGDAPLRASRSSIGPGEQFDQVDTGDGFVALRSHANGKFVTAEDSGRAPLVANRVVIGPWERFRLVHNGDGTIGLQANANGRFVATNGANLLVASGADASGTASFTRDVL
jgi:subtilisin family serine protease